MPIPVSRAVTDRADRAKRRVNGTVEYLGKANGKWHAVPGTSGSQIKGPASRIDLMKQLAGIDVQAMYPAGGRRKPIAGTSTFLAAEACFKGGKPFGIGLSETSDSTDTAGAFPQTFGRWSTPRVTSPSRPTACQ